MHFEAVMDDGQIATEDFELPDMGPAVIADMISTPPPSSAVEPGQTISLDAVGFQARPALGVSSLELVVDGIEIASAGNASGSTEPIPCDDLRFMSFIDTEYAIPDAPPPLIEICAVVTTFDGHRDESCINFTTGGVWHGTYHGTVTYACVPTPLDGRLDGVFTVTVADDPGIMRRRQGQFSATRDTSCLVRRLSTRPMCRVWPGFVPPRPTDRR